MYRPQRDDILVEIHSPLLQWELPPGTASWALDFAQFEWAPWETTSRDVLRSWSYKRRCGNLNPSSRNFPPLCSTINVAVDIEIIPLASCCWYLSSLTLESWPDI